MDNVYFPMTCNVLVPGHIKCLEQLSKYGQVTVGLLSEKALDGYKAEIMTFEDRKYILDKIAESFGNVTIVRQDSLDPSENVVKYGCTAMASGDGWEQSELDTMKRLGLKEINIISGHNLHSSNIYKQ